MKKLLVSFFVFIFCTMILTSCWDRRELNELYIVTALGIDKSEEGYLVTVQLINPGEIESEKSETDTPVTTYQSSGETVFEALRRLTLEAPRRLYGAHLRLVVFGEELAREDGIGKVIDFISRDHEIRTEFYMLVSKNSTAEELLNILTPLERIPANKIISTLEISERVWGSTRRIQLDELVSSLINEGKEPVLTGAIIRGNPDNGADMKILKRLDVPTAVETRYLAAFKKDKLIGWLNEAESIGYNHIVGGIKSTLITIPWNKEGKISVELIRTKQKIKGLVEDGEPKLVIEYQVEGNLGEVAADIDLSDEKNIHKIEKIVEEKIKEQMELTIEKVKGLESDILGFGEAIHRADPHAWKELKENWNSQLKTLKVDIRVTAAIKNLGNIMDPYQTEFKK